MKTERLSADELAINLMMKKEFLVFIINENGYFRPIYDVKPCLGHLCAVYRGEFNSEHWEATIGQITGESSQYADRQDTVGYIEYIVATLGKHAHSMHGLTKDRIACLFKRVSNETVIEIQRRNPSN